MNIVFDPPICHVVHVGVSSLIAKIQPTVLLFTARLDQRDYERLVKDKGRVQLWSDIPHDGAIGGGWHPLDFQESAKDAPSRDDDPTIISLNGPVIRPVGHERVLCLPVRLPTGISSLLRFQFTYRIAYPEERMVWMGGYRQNGSVVFDGLGARSTHGLVLKDGWSWSESRHAGVLEVEDGAGVDVMKIESSTDFRLLALGDHSTLPDLKDASLLFFIPRTQPNLTLRPTYVLATSPGLSLTVESDGSVALYGTGTALLEVHDMESTPYAFFERLLKHSVLGTWKTVLSDAAFHSILLTSRGPSQPLSGVVIPLWPSEHLIKPLHIHHRAFSEAVNLDVAKTMALFVPYNLKIYLLGPGNPQSESLTVHFDATNSEFIISPVYKLKSSGGTHEPQKKLGVAILTPHIIVPAPSPLPTPPPSPPPSLPDDPGHSWASVDTTIEPVEPSFDLHDAVKNSSVDVAPPPEPKPPVSTVVTAHSKALVRRTPSPAQSRSLITWLIRSLLISMSMFWRLLLRIFFLRLPSFDSLQTRSQHTQVDGDKGSSASDTEESATGMIEPEQQVEKHDTPEIITDEDTVSTTHHPEKKLADDSPGTLAKQERLAVPNLHLGPLPSYETILAELHPGTDGMNAMKSSAISTIALFPVESLLGTGQSNEAEISGMAPNFSDENIENAVRFLGSTTSQPECSVSKCKVVVQNRHARHEGGSNDDHGALLEFQLDWDDSQRGKTASISVPSDL